MEDRIFGMRVGLGSDVHLLEPGDGLRLAGVTIPCALRCARATSDGDVVLHALVDAMLGTCGLGDIGDYYPESRVTPGEDSRRFVVETRALLERHGARIVNIDCIVHLESPRLSPWKGRMAESLAAMLELGADRVNVKAKTAEGLGALGAGRAVAAQVAVLAAVSPG